VYLKRLEMLGFKSFASRTVLEFSPGITAIVGPNGSGKSNVADAMRWVLGEQNMRQLRGKKSDDIIFVGGQGRAALGMAEVSLTLDNSTGWVPSEYSEITVTRRSYRSGENEYLINKQKVRLKDIVLLLAQARIGHDSYTVIGQGMIDAALSLRAEERRGLFEDAAGIRPFQVQRAEAEGRLKQTEQNLERLRDIVSEIEPRLAPLAEQARRAVEYAQVSSELQEVLVTWYALQWRRLRASSEQAGLHEREQAQQVKQSEQRLREIDEQAAEQRSRRQRAQQSIAEARKAWGEASEQAQKFERDLAVNEERATGLERQRLDIQQEEQRLRQRLIALQKQLIDLEEQCDLADEAVDAGSASLATLEAQVNQAQKDYEMDERRLRNAQGDLVQVQARLGSTQTEIGRLQKQLGERNRTLAARRDTIASAQQNLRTLETRLVEERAHLETAREEERDLMQRRQAVARQIAEAQQEMERLKSTLNEAERQRRTVSDRLNMLKNWRQSLSGYSDGVRALLRAPAGKLVGLIGPVPQLGIVPAGMENALEAALGPYMQAIVTDTFEHARDCLDYLAANQAGKAMIVWIERASEDDVSQEVNAIQGQAEVDVLRRFLHERPALRDRVIGFAWQLVRCEPRYATLFRRLLRGVVVTRDIQAATELLNWAIPLSFSSDGDLPFSTLVTLQAETLHVDGWLSGGSGKDGAQQGLLAYERELRELPQQLEEHKQRIYQLNDALSEIQRAQEGRRIEQSGFDRALQKCTARINELNKTVANTQREQERSQTEIQLAATLEQQLASEVAGLEQELQAAQERARAHEKTQREMQGLVEELQYEMEERATRYRRQQDELGKARTALAVKRQESKSLRQQLETQRGQAQDLKSQVAQQVARSQENEQRLQALHASIEQQRGELARSRERVQTLGEQLRQIEGHLAQIDQRIAAVEQERARAQQAMSEQEAAYRRALLESQRARDAVESLLEQLREEQEIADPGMLIAQFEQQSSEGGQDLNGYANGHVQDTHLRQTVSEEESEQDGALTEEEESHLRKLRRRVESLRGRLKAMGGCDANAPQLYEETRTRYEFLSSQINDMQQAAQHLHSIISQLDATMARQFESTFEAINVRFRQHFTTLFNGGSARLELIAARQNEDEEGVSNSMPTGVEVIVQPPGKKVQDLVLLSGGERALVSAALLFSLLEINPPPFCLLDEVDAALDESNVTRFCDILKRLAQRTQFIVVTHNRVTMTVAQAIYGVSMRESVSRMLSLRLEEIEAVGGR
jgi:chromosome segregation protein